MKEWLRIWINKFNRDSFSWVILRISIWTLWMLARWRGKRKGLGFVFISRGQKWAWVLTINNIRWTRTNPQQNMVPHNSRTLPYQWNKYTTVLRSGKTYPWALPSFQRHSKQIPSWLLTAWSEVSKNKIRLWDVVI